MLAVRASKLLLKSEIKKVALKAFVPAVCSNFSTSTQANMKNITIIGSGLMGSGIAQVSELMGFYERMVL